MDHPDQIHLRDYVLAVDIGAFQSERGHEQRLRFDLTVDLAQPVAGVDDHVDRILSYDVLTDAVARTLADQRYNLLETVAEKIAAEVLAHPRAARVQVTVEKLDRVPGALGITISRSAARMETDTPTAAAPMLRLVMADAPLPQGAVILIPAAPMLPLPQGGNDRMVALLALDQAAWALAGRLGLDVADTRTELDWAVAQQLHTVWAPTRMVADEAGLDADPLALAQWLAHRTGAQRLEIALPPGAPAVASTGDPALTVAQIPGTPLP
ncbi:MAG: dihydroneopterin aldolase [Paracoccus sp. (in: a-proteobacteria)]|uniref:dihydroneopterin aldolase n=1 Tax=Paracoccus sp. TaxID=267 RepID=UPI0026DF97F0|nr:dihydroneopterin aldolase [Paracoccus sp. (in: a-proteobacteria)]MDO5614182.1 dihydroneopterin aldolase [Paracoccus sp. (in: a-proteobacteria)]